jgi:hypothetical protein
MGLHGLLQGIALPFYDVQIGSGAITYTQSFIKTGSAIEKLMGGGGEDSQTHRQNGDRTSLILFFQNKESRLKLYP